MAVCSGTKRDGGACTLPAMAGSPWCWNHDPARAGERKANASHAATTKHSKIDAEIRDVRLLAKELVEVTLAGRLDPTVKKRLTEIVQLLQVYSRLAELELTVGGRPRFSEKGEYGLPPDTAEKAKEWADDEAEIKREKEELTATLTGELGQAMRQKGYDPGPVLEVMESLG